MNNCRERLIRPITVKEESKVLKREMRSRKIFSSAPPRLQFWGHTVDLGIKLKPELWAIVLCNADFRRHSLLGSRARGSLKSSENSKLRDLADKVGAPCAL